MVALSELFAAARDAPETGEVDQEPLTVPLPGFPGYLYKKIWVSGSVAPHARFDVEQTDPDSLLGVFDAGMLEIFNAQREMDLTVSTVADYPSSVSLNVAGTEAWYGPNDPPTASWIGTELKGWAELLDYGPIVDGSNAWSDDPGLRPVEYPWGGVFGVIQPGIQAPAMRARSRGFVYAGNPAWVNVYPVHWDGGSINDFIIAGVSAASVSTYAEWRLFAVDVPDGTVYDDHANLGVAAWFGTEWAGQSTGYLENYDDLGADLPAGDYWLTMAFDLDPTPDTQVPFGASAGVHFLSGGAGDAPGRKTRRQLEHVGFNPRQAAHLQSEVLSTPTIRELQLVHGFTYRQALTLKAGVTDLQGLIRGGFGPTQAKEIADG